MVVAAAAAAAAGAGAGAVVMVTDVVFSYQYILNIAEERR